MKRFECDSSSQETYSNYEDKILRKAQELSTLCETDLALLMFSLDGQFTSFGSNGRVEDTFLRFLDRPEKIKGPIQNAEYLSLKLKELKGEAELLEKIATIEDLEENLDQINRQKLEAEEKLRYYNPDVEKISSVAEAKEYEKFVTSALERIRLSKEMLLCKQIVGDDIERNEDTLQGTAIMQQDDRSYEQDKFLHEQIVQQDIEGYEQDKFLHEQIVQQDTESYEVKLLLKEIVPQKTESYEVKHIRPERDSEDSS